MITTLLTATLETAFNRFLRLDPYALKRMMAFEGKVVLIELPDWKLKFYLLLTGTGIKFLNHYTGPVDTSIRGTPLTLFRLSNTSNQALATVSIEGNIELGQQFREWLHNIDIDWEEHLSKITGDVVSHQIGNITRRFLNWGKQTRNSLQQNLTEYLQEEACYLPPRLEIEDFFSDVKNLQHDLARLEARMQHLG